MEPYLVYRPPVEYDYELAGQVYDGDRISAASLWAVAILLMMGTALLYLLYGTKVLK